jgi:hypothetical protein
VVWENKAQLREENRPEPLGISVQSRESGNSEGSAGTTGRSTFQEQSKAGCREVVISLPLEERKKRVFGIPAPWRTGDKEEATDRPTFLPPRMQKHRKLYKIH